MRSARDARPRHRARVAGRQLDTYVRHVAARRIAAARRRWCCSRAASFE
jgi:hypothetical protein